MEMLKALECVDMVRPYDELEYVSGCKEINADIFVIGEDWGSQPHNIAVESYLKSEGKQIHQVLYSPVLLQPELNKMLWRKDIVEPTWY